MQSTRTLAVRDLIRLVEHAEQPEPKTGQAHRFQPCNDSADFDASRNETAKQPRAHAWQVPPGQLNRAMKRHPEALTEEQILEMRCLYYAFFRYGSATPGERDRWEEVLDVQLQRAIVLLYDLSDPGDRQQAKEKEDVTGTGTEEP